MSERAGNGGFSCGHAKCRGGQVGQGLTAGMGCSKPHTVNRWIRAAQTCCRLAAGRQVPAGYLGFGHGHALFEQPGLGQVPGTAPLTTGGIRRRAPRRHRRWQDVAPHEARAVISAAVAREEWRGPLDLNEAGPLADLADDTFSFGFSGAGRGDVGADRAGDTGAPPGRRRAGVLTGSPAVVAAGGTRGSAVPGIGRLAAAGRAGRGAGRPGTACGQPAPATPRGWRRPRERQGTRIAGQR